METYALVRVGIPDSIKALREQALAGAIMSFRYCHTLIPKSPTFVAAPEQVQAFLRALIARGVMGGVPEVILRTPSDRTREFRNPFTGKTDIVHLMDMRNLFSVQDVAQSIAEWKEYRVEASGTGRPENPPMLLELDDPYYVGVVCVLVPELRSTSDWHEESGDSPGIPPYDEPCARVINQGVFCNPHTLEVIEVLGAGCARFWIEFQLGNSLFPPFDRPGLDFLDPFIADTARQVFQTAFVQGCQWG